MPQPELIRIKTTTAKFTTLVDGTRRIYLDLVDADSDAIIALLATQAPGILVEWAGVPITLIINAPEPIVKQLENNAVSEGTKRKSRWEKA